MDAGDWVFAGVMGCIIGIIVLAFLEENEITDVVSDIPRIEQPKCIGDHIIVGRDE